MEVLNKLQILGNKTQKKLSFQVLILECKANKNSYQGKILGLTLPEWIKFSCENIPCNIVKFDEKTNVIDFAKKHLNKTFDYTIILLSKTPLIQSYTINKIIEYVSVKECLLCKLPLGYVIKNSVKNDVQIDSIYSQDMEDFYVVESKVQYNYAYRILQDRILNFHLNNGVEILSPDKTYIEPFVDIANDVILYPNNSIKGTSVIDKGVILKENNVIENSKIGGNSCISGSVISNSIISNNVYISAFGEFENCLIGADTLIEKGVCIHNYKVDNNSKIKANTILGETNDSNRGIR